MARSGDLELWDVARAAKLWSVHAHAQGITCVRFSHDEREIFTGSFDPVVAGWSAQDGHPIFRAPGAEGTVTLLAIAPDERHAGRGRFGRRGPAPRCPDGEAAGAAGQRRWRG